MGTIISRHRGRIILSATFAALSAACSLAPYVAVYATISALFDSTNTSGYRIIWIATCAAFALVGKAFFASIANHQGHIAAYAVLAQLRLSLVEAFQSMPLGRAQTRSTGEIKKILHDDVEQIEEALAHGIPDAAAATTVPLATTIILFAIDWRLAAVALLSLILFLGFSIVAMSLAQKNNLALAEHSTIVNQSVMGYLRGIAVIRAFLHPQSTRSQAHAAIEEQTRLEQEATSGAKRWLASGLTVATSLTVALMLPAAGLLAINGSIGLGTLTLFLIISLAYLGPVISLVGTLALIATRFQVAAQSIAAILKEERLPIASDPRTPLAFDITFDNLSFSYDNQTNVLSDINLHLPEGQTLAIVGETGSGKTTLARLIARFHDPTQGSVRIGGVDCCQISPQDLQRIVAFIQQDEYIFEASLLENIRLARPEATDEEVRQAGYQAQLEDVVAGLENGWDTLLAAGGSTLSGGQRQRIAIARALLKNAPIIILDEATASLDALTEKATLDAIATLTHGRTVITIAHRLATIEQSDQIAVMAHGRITALGTHSSLAVGSPEYQALWNAYHNADGWTLRPSGSLGISHIPIQRRASSSCEANVTSPVALSDSPPRGISRMRFLQQWRYLYGESFAVLIRQGLIRLFLEGALRGLPMLVIFALLLSAIGRAPWGPLSPSLVMTMSVLLLISLLLRLAAATWSNALVWRLASESKKALQLSVLERLRRVPLGFFTRNDMGRTGTLICNDIPLIDFQNIPQQVIGSLIQPVYASAVLLILDWRLGIAALGGIPFFWAMTALSDRIYGRVFSDVHAARHEAASALVEQARGAAVLRGLPPSTITQRYEKAVEALRRTSVAMATRAIPSSAVGATAVEAGLVLVIIFGSILHDQGGVSSTTLLLFLLLSLVLYQPMQELSSLAAYRRNQQQIAAKLGAVWDATTLPEPLKPLSPEGSSIAFKHVSFAYEKNPVLSEVSFTALPGQITAIVGPSGAGKSTLAHLAARMWDVDTGSIVIGGKDIRDLGQDELFDALTVVPQDPYLFNDTVRANLALASPTASDEEMWRALRAAQCDDVISLLPNGLDSAINDGGTNLSGGQRQRVSIARALLKDSPIIILDEAVAAVDPATEDRIQQALSALVSGKTVLVIAHRLTTIAAADQIIVVNQGRIEAHGIHTELLRSSPTYRQLADAQGLTFDGK